MKLRWVEIQLRGVIFILFGAGVTVFALVSGRYGYVAAGLFFVLVGIGVTNFGRRRYNQGGARRDAD